MASEIIKQRVIDMRARGATYGDIARETKLSRNTVKSICRRATIEISVGESRGCEQCGQVLETESWARRFCSDACRLAWWHAHPEQLNRQAIYSFTCHGCGTSFEAYGNKGRKYCTHACYVCHRFGTRGGRP